MPCSWDFGGAEIPHPFFSYSLQAPVTFVLEEGEPGRTFDLELTVYDGYGASTKRSVQVDVVP